jgi:hypothetical protein
MTEIRREFWPNWSKNSNSRLNGVAGKRGPFVFSDPYQEAPKPENQWQKKAQIPCPAELS